MWVHAISPSPVPHGRLDMARPILHISFGYAGAATSARVCVVACMGAFVRMWACIRMRMLVRACVRACVDTRV